MKTNIGKISMITLGFISVGLVITSAVGLWVWRSASVFSHGMHQNFSVMYSGTSPWGILLAIGVILLVAIGAISMIKDSADQITREIPLCAKCGEELVNPDWEFCPACGEPAGAK